MSDMVQSPYSTVANTTGVKHMQSAWSARFGKTGTKRHQNLFRDGMSGTGTTDTDRRTILNAGHGPLCVNNLGSHSLFLLFIVSSLSDSWRKLTRRRPFAFFSVLRMCETLSSWQEFSDQREADQ
jgi:hypothetical protein